MDGSKYENLLNFSFVAPYNTFGLFATERCGREAESTRGRRWAHTGNGFAVWCTRQADRLICEGYIDMDHIKWKEHLRAVVENPDFSKLVIHRDN